jgi:predicted acetyltransferase
LNRTDLKLRQPAVGDEAAFLRAYETTKDSDPNFAKFYHSGMDFREWLNVLVERGSGVGVEADQGSLIFLFAWIGGDIVGRVTFRPYVKEPLLKARGHVGYIVVPEYRRRGYATEMLRLALPIAKDAGLKRVLVGCDDGNIGSQKTIERCGGVFEELHYISGRSVPKRVYWIELR